MSGSQMGYPVYVTLGHIGKSVKRKSSEDTMVLLGCLVVDKFEGIPLKEARERLTGELVHCAMDVLLEPLREASAQGVEIWCADGGLRLGSGFCWRLGRAVPDGVCGAGVMPNLLNRMDRARRL
jgi:hypothetical protein